MNIIEIYNVANDSDKLSWYFFLSIIFGCMIIHALFKTKDCKYDERFAITNSPWKPYLAHRIGPREQIMIACIGLIVVMFIFFYREDKKSLLVTNLNEGYFQTVEGKVENFKNVYTNKYIESFTIKGINFEYHKYLGYGYKSFH